MNLNGDEKRIRQLFREMSLDDQRRAPEFAGVLAAANSGMASSQNRARPWRFAMAAAMLCAALLIAMAIIVRPSKPQGTAAHDDQASTPAVQPEAQPNVVPYQPGVEAANVGPRRVIIKRVRHRPPSDQMAIAMKSLFAWKSPTASLLQTPGGELLRSLPRLGESLKTIKSFSPDEFN
jgi:hypothetical protein